MAHGHPAVHTGSSALCIHRMHMQTRKGLPPPHSPRTSCPPAHFRCTGPPAPQLCHSAAPDRPHCCSCRGRRRSRRGRGGTPHPFPLQLSAKRSSTGSGTVRVCTVSHAAQCLNAASVSLGQVNTPAGWHPLPCPAYLGLVCRRQGHQLPHSQPTSSSRRRAWPPPEGTARQRPT